MIAPKNTRVAKSTDPLVLTTEHIVDEEKRIVTAINYNNCQSEIKLQLLPEWKIGKVYYGNENPFPNDILILEVIKKNDA